MTAPAKFRRITKRTKVTAPCVLARQHKDGFWWSMVVYIQPTVERLRSDYTHWLPIQFPEVRG